MFEAPGGIIFRPRSVRVRLQAEGPGEALATSIDGWDAIDLYFSDLAAAFLAGEIKRVANWMNLINKKVFISYSLVPTHASEREAVAAIHRAALLTELAKQYKDAVARSIGGGPKTVKHRRQRANAALGVRAEPDAVADYYSHEAAALEACQPIRNLWTRISSGEDW